MSIPDPFTEAAQEPTDAELDDNNPYEETP